MAFVSSAYQYCTVKEVHYLRWAGREGHPSVEGIPSDAEESSFCSKHNRPLPNANLFGLLIVKFLQAYSNCALSSVEPVNMHIGE